MFFFLLAATLCVCLYAGIMLAMSVAVTLNRAALPSALDEYPPLAIVVAARNEEKTLPRCLAALSAQNYPEGLLDIYIADDQSTDHTADVIMNAAGSETGHRVHFVSVPETAGNLRGKANALHAVITSCDHELILITDADCAPPVDWAKNHAAYFAEPMVGMVCGHTEVQRQTLLDAVQALDWTYLLTSASVLNESGRPFTAMGNNMSVRRAAYESVGGYPALPFSVTEDYALFQTVARHSQFNVRFPLDSGLRTVTLPLNSWREVYNQRRRWARGGLRAPVSFYGIFLLAHLTHLLPLVILLVSPLFALSLIALKCLGDLSLLWAALGIRNRRRLLFAFPVFEGYLFAYMISLPLTLLLFRQISWKNRRH